MAVYTTEIASDKITSDNPIHQRLLKAYYIAKEYVNGDLLEIGCGEGRGVGLLHELVNSYTGIDKPQYCKEQPKPYRCAPDACEQISYKVSTYRL